MQDPLNRTLCTSTSWGNKGKSKPQTFLCNTLVYSFYFFSLWWQWLGQGQSRSGIWGGPAPWRGCDDTLQLWHGLASRYQVTGHCYRELKQLANASGAVQSHAVLCLIYFPSPLCLLISSDLGEQSFDNIPYKTVGHWPIFYRQSY